MGSTRTVMFFARVFFLYSGGPSRGNAETVPDGIVAREDLTNRVTFHRPSHLQTHVDWVSVRHLCSPGKP